MQPVTIREIDEHLKRLPPEKLVVVYDFVRFLTTRGAVEIEPGAEEESTGTMIAFEPVLSRDRGRPEEDEAWAHLQRAT
jgi:hypothetical protein